MKNQSGKGPILNLDLEKFRVKHGLSISTVCELLGLQRAKWAAMFKRPTDEVDDMAVCITMTFYENHPETMPITRVIDIRRWMEEHNYDPDSPQDKKEFAGAIGREAAATYRYTNGQGSVSKPVERLLEAVDRLHTESGKKKRAELERVAQEVAERMGVHDPLRRGSWRRDS